MKLRPCFLYVTLFFPLYIRGFVTLLRNSHTLIQFIFNIDRKSKKSKSKDKKDKKRSSSRRSSKSGKSGKSKKSSKSRDSSKKKSKKDKSRKSSKDKDKDKKAPEIVTIPPIGGGDLNEFGGPPMCI